MKWVAGGFLHLALGQSQIQGRRGMGQLSCNSRNVLSNEKYKQYNLTY